MVAIARKPAPSVTGDYSPRARQQPGTLGPLASPGRPRGGVASDAEALEGEAARLETIQALSPELQAGFLDDTGRIVGYGNIKWVDVDGDVEGCVQ